MHPAELPFFEDRHRALAADLAAWARTHIPTDHPADVDERCRDLVRQLGAAGWLRHAIGGTAFGASGDAIDTRAVCLIRETLAEVSGLADFAFAM
jgi:hypothetical protein